jgi:hypothetical protein
MDVDIGHPAVGDSQGTVLLIDDEAVFVEATRLAEGDAQETPLVIDEDEMHPEMQITILVEDIMVVNHLKQRIERPVSLTIPANAGDQNHIPISPVSGPWAEAYPGFDPDVIPANWDSFDLNDIYPPRRQFLMFADPFLAASPRTPAMWWSGATLINTSGLPIPSCMGRPTTHLTETEQLRTKMLALMQPELPGLNNADEVILAESFHGVVPYDRACNLGMPFMLRDPTIINQSPSLSALYQLHLVDANDNPNSTACRFHRNLVFEWSLIFDLLQRTEILLKSHRSWPSIDPGTALITEFHRRPSQYNIGRDFPSARSARWMSRVVRNAFLVMIADVTAVYALLSVGGKQNEIRQYMVESRALPAAWIDDFFNCPAFNPKTPRTGMALYMSISKGNENKGEMNLTSFPRFLIKTLIYWGIPLQVWWPHDQLDRRRSLDMADLLRPTDDEQERAAKFRDAVRWPTPRCHTEANQVVDGRILPLNEFFNLRYRPGVGPGREGHDDEITEGIRVLDVPMFWWMQDGPYLVRTKVHPESHTQLFGAYNSCQRVFDFRTGEWDIYGGWGLAGVDARQRHVMQPRPSLKLVDPDNCMCGVYKTVGSHREYMQEFDDDPQIFDDFNSSQGTELLGIEGCFTTVSFGVSPAEQQQLQEEYDKILEATGNVVEFEELRKVHIAYIGSPPISLQHRYGLKYWSSRFSQPNISVHWKNDDGSALTPYNLKGLSRIIGSRGNDNDWSPVNIPIARDYVRYVELNQHVNGVPDALHDWRESFEHAWSSIRLDIKKLNFTKRFDDNALFLDQQRQDEQSVTKSAYVLSTSRPEDGRGPFKIVLLSPLSAMEAVREINRLMDPTLRISSFSTASSHMRLLALHLTSRGIPFWTAITRPSVSQAIPRSNSGAGLPVLIKSHFVGKAAVRDFAAWEALVRKFLLTHRARAAILAGGIYWRVANEYGPHHLTSIAVDGPAYNEQEGWGAFAEDDNGTQYCDDILSPEERRLLCGTYVTVAGTMQSRFVSIDS